VKDGEVEHEEGEVPSKGGGNIGDCGWSHGDDLVQRTSGGNGLEQTCPQQPNN